MPIERQDTARAAKIQPVGEYSQVAVALEEKAAVDNDHDKAMLSRIPLPAWTLIKRLSDENPQVRQHAYEALRKRGERILPALRKKQEQVLVKIYALDQQIVDEAWQNQENLLLLNALLRQDDALDQLIYAIEEKEGPEGYMMKNATEGGLDQDAAMLSRRQFLALVPVVGLGAAAGLWVSRDHSSVPVEEKDVVIKGADDLKLEGYYLPSDWNAGSVHVFDAQETGMDRGVSLKIESIDPMSLSYARRKQRYSLFLGNTGQDPFSVEGVSVAFYGKNPEPVVGYRTRFTHETVSYDQYRIINIPPRQGFRLQFNVDVREAVPTYAAFLIERRGQPDTVFLLTDLPRVGGYRPHSDDNALLSGTEDFAILSFVPGTVQWHLRRYIGGDFEVSEEAREALLSKGRGAIPVLQDRLNRLVIRNMEHEMTLREKEKDAAEDDPQDRRPSERRMLALRRMDEARLEELIEEIESRDQAMVTEIMDMFSSHRYLVGGSLAAAYVIYEVGKKIKRSRPWAHTVNGARQIIQQPHRFAYQLEKWQKALNTLLGYEGLTEQDYRALQDVFVQGNQDQWKAVEEFFSHQRYLVHGQRQRELANQFLSEESLKRAYIKALPRKHAVEWLASRFVEDKDVIAAFQRVLQDPKEEIRQSVAQHLTSVDQLIGYRKALPEDFAVRKVQSILEKLPLQEKERELLSLVASVGTALKVEVLQLMLRSYDILLRQLLEEQLTETQVIEGYRQALPQEFAMQALAARKHNPRAIEGLQEVLQSPYPERRRLAEKYLSEAELIEGYIRWLPQEFAIQWLIDLDDENVHQRLMAFLDDRGWKNREKLARRLLRHEQLFESLRLKAEATIKEMEKNRLLAQKALEETARTFGIELSGPLSAEDEAMPVEGLATFLAGSVILALGAATVSVTLYEGKNARAKVSGPPTIRVARKILKNPFKHPFDKVEGAIAVLKDQKAFSPEDEQAIMAFLSLETVALRRLAEKTLPEDQIIRGYISALPQWFAIDALGERSDRRVYGALRKMLSHPEETVRQRAEQYLTIPDRIDGYLLALPRDFAVQGLMYIIETHLARSKRQALLNEVILLAGFPKVKPALQRMRSHPDEALQALARLFLEKETVYQSETPGGIDMNSIRIDRSGKNPPIEFDTPKWAPSHFRHMDGFSPVIINITPVTSIYPLLGLAEPAPPPSEISRDLPPAEDPQDNA
jgi:hypothetical protein